ncbi:hypothetical protein Q5752_003027 [Cryptotrichosporon argae]
MPDSPPPSYERTAPAPAPALEVTTPAGAHVLPDASAGGVRPRHARTGSAASAASDTSELTDDEGGGLHPGLDEDGRRSMDDERRDLPEGWVRCFDPKEQHHFYVDTRTKRATWVHPYDDAEFLRSLPRSHPAHPDSHEAQAVRKRSEDEKTLLDKARAAEAAGGAGAPGPSGAAATSSAVTGKVKGAQTATNAHGDAHGDEHDRNWFQKKKDQLIGTKEERAQAKGDKRRQRKEAHERALKAQADYIKRRDELIKKQLQNDPSIRMYYAGDPFAYAPPLTPYSRTGGLYSSPYGYGYSGGYGRRYGYGYGGYGGYGGLGGGYGMGMGMMGGLAGGLLLGDMISGGF